MRLLLILTLMTTPFADLAEQKFAWPQPPTWLRQIAETLAKNPEVIYERLSDEQVTQLEADLAAEYEQLEDARCELSSYYWLTTHTKTENKHHEKQGLAFKAPLPRKTYLKTLFQYFHSIGTWEVPRLFIPKSRQMITSISAVGYGTHAAQYRRAEVVVQCDSEDKAKELVHLAVVNYEEQPTWLRRLHPLKRRPNDLELDFAAGGRLIGIPSGEHKIRLYHPTIYILDEAAFQPGAEGCYNYALPVASEIIVVSSAGPGWFGTQCARPV